MRKLNLLLAGFVFVVASSANAQPRRKSKPATQADIERLEKKIEDQQKMVDKLVRLQQQYLHALNTLFDKSPGPVAVEPRPVEPPRPVVVDTRPSEPKPRVKETAKPKKPPKEDDGVGTIVGKIAGAEDAIVYVDDIVKPVRATATMKQEGKQFLPKVLVVTKGTTVGFPNLDAIFHNVFSVTPDHSFDLGSYPKGETRTVKMSKSGVVTVYCNMHPQMVGHILVVPNGNYVKAGKDGFFRLPNVPAGNHRVVAWAPNAKPMTAMAEVVDGEVVTIEMSLKKGRLMPHAKKDGLPYGSYDK